MGTTYKHNIYVYRSRTGDIPVVLREERYKIGMNLCLRLICEDGTPYATLTKCFVPLQDGFAFVDNVNLPEAIDFIERNGLGKFMGQFYESGYCRYPLYRFYMDTIRR